jgi:FkbM family methyltransferase
MGANSLLRRGVKATLRPLLNDTTYSCLQGIAQAYDIRRRKWYEPEVDLVAVAVQPGDQVLDLGANYGLYTYHLSRAVGDGGRVYAFEPLPFTNRTLALVVRLLGLRNVTIVPKGCSNAPGTVTFRLPIQASGAPGAGQAHIAARNDDRPGSETQVRWNRTANVECEVVALDEYLSGELSRVSLIKADIEGAELLAFRGAARIIEQHRPSVICEINPWFLDGFNLRLEDLVGFFSDRGYCLYRYTPDKRLVTISSLDEVVEDNYVFIHSERLAAFAPLLQSH